MAVQQINEPDVVYEDFGQDGVLLNLQTGAYFSITGKAKVMLDALIAGADDSVLVAQLKAVDVDSGSQAQKTVEDLLEFGLIAPTATATPKPVDDSFVASVQNNDGGFQLEAHSDLADVIAADPIHDL